MERTGSVALYTLTFSSLISGLFMILNVTMPPIKKAAAKIPVLSNKFLINLLTCIFDLFPEHRVLLVYE